MSSAWILFRVLVGVFKSLLLYIHNIDICGAQVNCSFED